MGDGVQVDTDDWITLPNGAVYVTGQNEDDDTEWVLIKNSIHTEAKYVWLSATDIARLDAHVND